MFGYSLPQKALTSVEEEAKAMWDVLNDAAHSKPSAGTNFRSERSVVQQLSTMFTSRSAEMGSASRHISRETIEKLKKYLMKWIFSRKWHHIAEERDEVTKLIRIKYIRAYNANYLWHDSQNPCFYRAVKGLSYGPLENSREYCDILCKYKPLHTAAEEEIQRFQRASILEQVSTERFAVLVNRQLRVCVHACPQMAGLEVQIVGVRRRLQLNILYLKESGTIKAQDEWLRSEFAAAELGLEEVELNFEDLLFHTVKALFMDVFGQLDEGMFAKSSGDVTETPLPSILAQEEGAASYRAAADYVATCDACHVFPKCLCSREVCRSARWVWKRGRINMVARERVCGSPTARYSHLRESQANCPSL